MDLKDLRARILASKPKITTLPVPEWEDLPVGVRCLTLAERLAFETENGALDDTDRKKDPAKYTQWLVRYVIACACDADGVRLFAPEDERTLMSKSALAIERVCLVAMRVNAITAAEVARLGEVSGEARNGASPSDSPVTSG